MLPIFAILSLLLPVFGLEPVVFPGLPSMRELIERDGVASTNYLVKTEDGYLVFLHRMGNNTGDPVLLQHGLLDAADRWLARNIWDVDLPSTLLQAGYDVYLGNFRGNCFSPGHVKYKRSDPRFWNFSVHEHGYYDLPAMIDWILKFRSTDKLFFIGHSLGSTSFFVMGSTRPEYNQKIKTAALLAPVAYLPDRSEFAVGFLRMAILNSKQLARTLKSSNIWELFPRTVRTIRGVQDICRDGSSTMDFCLDLLGGYIGEHRANLNRKTVGYEISFAPAGTSSNTLTHLAQIFNTMKFAALDLGQSENLRRYNSTVAPRYPLEKVTSPIAIFWSYNDNLVSEKSVNKLIDALPNLIRRAPLGDPKFTHADYFMGRNAKELVYDRVVDIMNRYR